MDLEKEIYKKIGEIVNATYLDENERQIIFSDVALYFGTRSVEETLKEIEEVINYCNQTKYDKD